MKFNANCQSTLNENDVCAPVLTRMIELLGSKEGDKLTFAAAMKQASAELGIAVQKHMEIPLLLTAFRVIGSGKIPGLPEA